MLSRVLLTVGALAVPLAVHAADVKKPNIVLVMVDDYGYECVRCNGGTSYQTPHLDALAATGVRFTHAYSTPLCTPTRTQIMTGRYNFRNYVTFGELDLKERTFGHVLKDAGYATMIAGKWQLAGGLDGPHKAGFDEYCLWQIFTENKGSRYDDPKAHANGKLLPDLEGKYGPDVYERHIEDFVTRHKDRPFFVYWPMALTHSPFVPTPDSEKGKRTQQQNFADMVAYTDKLVGKLMTHLDKLGVRENTLLVFTGDNGTGRQITSVLNGREVQGDKGRPTTLGTHVPLIVNWPAAAAKGQVCDDLIDFTDILPTLSDAAGAPLPKGVTLDGRSFLPQVKGEKGTPREWIFCHYEPRHGGFKGVKLRYAQDHRYKLYHDGRLFDMTEDLLEKRPLDAGEQPEIRKKLQAVLDHYEEEQPLRGDGSR